MTVALSLLLLTMTHASLTKRVDIALAPSEAIYLTNAPEDIALAVDALDTKIGFGIHYEVTSPTRAGLDINPWNSMINSGINPSTKNILFIINPDFFAQLSKEEQSFVLTKAFLRLKDGISSLTLQVLPWIIVILKIIFFVSIIYNIVLKRRFDWILPMNGRSKTIMRIILTISINIGAQRVLSTIHFPLHKYVGQCVDKKLNLKALKLSGESKENALSALAKYDATIKNDLQGGNWFWKPYATVFESQIKSLV